MLMFAGCAHEPSRTQRFAQLDAVLDTEMRELPMPGVSAALMERGRIVWTCSRGYADIEAQIPMSADTPFNIASLTKPMTSVVLMQLVQSGQLSLDTPMQRYDPTDFTDPRITVGHVLSMTSEANPPGSHYQYNGNPYGMLDTVIRGVAGESLAKAFSSRIIEPLHLSQTSPGDLSADAQGLSPELAARYQSIFARVARAYNLYGGTEPIRAIPPDATPNAAANVIGTASDYARFADAVMRGRFLNPATMQTMWTNARSPSGEQFPYAYGWFVEDYRGHHLIYHYGYYDSFSAVLLIVPERELVFVALSNWGALSGHNGIDAIEGNVFACAVLVEFVDPTLPCTEGANANVARWRARFPPPPPEIASDPAALPRYVGTYRLLSGREANVEAEQDHLFWHSPAGRFPLTQIGPDRFVMKTDSRTMNFVSENGRVTRIDITYPGDTNTYVVPRLR
jgi:CubicO group peptidase (beta-lactamase class C family)